MEEVVGKERRPVSSTFRYVRLADELEGKIRKTAEDFPKLEADLTKAWNESR